jgi:hypothetical protein
MVLVIMMVMMLHEVMHHELTKILIMVEVAPAQNYSGYTCGCGAQERWIQSDHQQSDGCASHIIMYAMICIM